jgi:hypothetical protein
MAEDKDEISNGPNDRSMIAGTGPGIPDDALGPGEELPEPPSDADVERAAEALGVTSKEKLPLEGQ